MFHLAIIYSTELYIAMASFGTLQTHTLWYLY